MRIDNDEYFSDNYWTCIEFKVYKLLTVTIIGHNRKIIFGETRPMQNQYEYIIRSIEEIKN